MHPSFLLRGASAEPALLVRRQRCDGAPVLYVHGATFPSALSVGYRFGGTSWMDDLNAAGFDSWAFDFAGYGGSDRYPAMFKDGQDPPAGRSREAAGQIARVVAHIIAHTGHARVAILAHSWGTVAAGLYATMHPECVSCLCLFGPVTQRDGSGDSAHLAAWRTVTVAEQLARFIADVPRGHPPVLIEPELHAWGPTFLASDADAASRNPPAVKIPNGPVADIRDAWCGRLAYRPEDIRSPMLVVRGEWDSVTNDADAQWLLSRASHVLRRDAKIPKGTHLMHLEHSREGLFQAVRAFLAEAQS